MSVTAAISSIVLHVANYNATAQIEFHTRIFTKLIGKNVIYFYACYLVLSALIRDYFIKSVLIENAGSMALFGENFATYLGYTLIASGILLNLWTLKALGIKGMYNGDSFGWIMDAPVMDGPYTYFNDPQYVGTVIAFLGYAISYQSLYGYFLTIVMAIVFYISVKFIEGPHMNRIYSNKAKSKLY